MHIAWIPVQLAETLTAIQDVTGMSQREIARIAGVNRSQVNRWSHGESQPGYDKITRVALAIRQRGHEALAQQLMTASGYGVLPDGDTAPEAEPETEWERWERSVLTNPHLPRDVAEAMVRDARDARDAYQAESSAGQPGGSSSGPSRPSAAAAG